MAEKNNRISSVRSKSYFKNLILVLMLVQILDSYVTLFPGAIPSAIANEFLSGMSVDVQNSIMAFASGIVTIGMMLVFFNQYLCDKLGRKKILGITVAGMALASLGMFFSVNYVMYMVFVFFLYFFFTSDIWLIYINEEVIPNKRALYSNIVLMVGLVGALSMVICRLIFITETDPFWRGMTFFLSSIYLSLFEKYINDVGTLAQEQVTLIFFLTVFTVLIAYAINGFLADRIGRKPLLYLWSCLSPISVVIWVFGAFNTENALGIVMFGYALSHIAYWGSIGIIRLITIESLPTDRRGTGVGFRSFIGALGVTVGLLLSSVVILFLGLGPTFIIFVMGNFFVIPLAVLFVKETKGVELSEIK